MRLYIMRHGPAEESSPSGRDYDRPLSEPGRTRTNAVAHELARRGERPQKIFSSPLVRARQTADIVARVLGIAVEIRDELAPSEAAPDVVREITDAALERVVLVGHAPDVSILVAELIGTHGHAPGFEPAMVVAIDVAPGASSKEAFVIRPSALSGAA
jgi:phosphohistidine phosphatase